MVTRFEKRTVAWMLAAVMCLSMVLSGKTVAYAKDNSQTDVPGGAAAESSEGTEEDVETEESVPAIAESPDYAEENKEVKTEENQETKEAEKEAKATETFGDYEYRILDGGTVEIVKYNGAGGETVIPDSIDGKEVSRIGMSAFENTQVTQVSIPSTVTELEYYIFWNCSDLKKVILPENGKLETIHKHAFSSSGLEEINLLAVKKIDDNAFWDCPNLQSVTLGNQLTAIGEGAFADTGLRKIDIPDSVASIGSSAFGGCVNLEEVKIGNKLAYIAENAFGGCGLTSITIGNQVKKIGQSAFARNNKLTEVNIPENVTEIEYAGFLNCSNLNNVRIPESLEKIGGHALDLTAWYNGKENGIVYAGNVLYDYKGDMPSGTVIEAKEGTLGIAGYAFDGDKNLKEIKIPETVTNIGDFAFHDCISMTSVVIPENVTEIGKMALGYKTKEAAQSGKASRMAGDNSEKISGFTIYGKAGSAAQTYAKDNSFTFVTQKTDNPMPSGLRIVPEVTDTTYVIGSGEGVTITCTGELKDFVNVMMDGQVVESGSYTVREGSTILTFVSKYLDTLSVGRHTVTLNYTYGSVSTELKVLEKGANGEANGTADTDSAGTANRTNGSGSLVSPRTGDSAPVMLWVLTAMCATGIGVIIIRKRLA